MGWFDLDADGAERALRAAFATVLDTATAQPVGGGVFLTGRSVLTCAHVVNAALGRSMFEPGNPGDATLTLEFPDGSAQAVIRTWIAPRAPGGGPAVLGALEWQGDLAVLELTTRPPAPVRPQRWSRMVRRQKVRAWYGTGHRVSFVDTTVKLCDPDASYLDAEAATGPAIGPGYSGGPLWSYEQEAVVGLVVGQLYGTQAQAGRGYADRAFALSWQTIRAELERELGPAALRSVLPPEPGAHPQGPSARDAQRRIAFLVRGLLPDVAERGVHARYLAAECGLPAGPAGTGPAPEVLAEVLCTVPRALAALVESLVRERPDEAGQFLALGRAAGAPKLLSPGEHSWLVDLLGPRDVPVLAEAAQTVLPTLGLGPGSPKEALVERLEAFTGGNSVAGPGRPRIPALLKVAAYTAAALDRAGPERPGEELREWSRLVARRLGAPQAVLAEYADEAAEWAARGQAAKARSAAPRVAVRLTRYEHGSRGTAGRFRCALWTDPGDGGLRAVPLPGPHPLGPEQVARLIRTTLAVWDEPEEAVGADRPGPVVELFLDEPELGLPVEEWDSADPEDPADDGEPEPLGMAHPVVVRLAASLSPVRELCATSRGRSTGTWTSPGSSSAPPTGPPARPPLRSACDSASPWCSGTGTPRGRSGPRTSTPSTRPGPSPGCPSGSAATAPPPGPTPLPGPPARCWAWRTRPVRRRPSWSSPTRTRTTPTRTTTRTTLTSRRAALHEPAPRRAGLAPVPRRQRPPRARHAGGAAVAQLRAVGRRARTPPLPDRPGRGGHRQRGPAPAPPAARHRAPRHRQVLAGARHRA